MRNHLVNLAAVVCLASAAYVIVAGQETSELTTNEASHGAGLYPGFTGYARKVTTDSPLAQTWFDQGIQLFYLA